MKSSDPTQRFSHTVENYINFRPSYPDTIISFMKTNLGLHTEAVIADIGSGTGKLTELFVKSDFLVYAVEPNPEMRLAAEKSMSNFPNFRSIDGTAENTTLKDHTVDFITAGQAFHWFQPDQTKVEFQRILKPGGKILLIWNKREDEKSPFMEAYDSFLTVWATDYQETCLRKIDDKILKTFYHPLGFYQKNFYHFQEFDRQGLMGRYLSCSYAFTENHPQHEAAIKALNELFDRYQENGKVKMWYRTEVYYNI